MTNLGYPEPGEMLGPFRIVRRLGFGGMGMVVEAMEGTLNPRSGRCTATSSSPTCCFIAEVGLAVLVEAGFSDEDFAYVDRSQDASTPRMRKALTSVVSDCSLSGLRTP